MILRSDSSLDDRKRSGKTLLAKRIVLERLKSTIDCVVPIGKANEEYWKYYFGEKFPMSPMPYAVDNSFFQGNAGEASPHRETLRRELGLEPGRPVILYASKLQSRKCCIDLVEAYTWLAPAPGVDPAAYLLIIGDGEERAAVEARAQASGLSSIRFLGFRNQTELPRFFDLCDIFVLPSIHEPRGLIVNEVMNAGRAVVVTDQVGCQPDLVQNALRVTMGENGLRLIGHQSFEEDVPGLRRASPARFQRFRRNRGNACPDPPGLSLRNGRRVSGDDQLGSFLTPC